MASFIFDPLSILIFAAGIFSLSLLLLLRRSGHRSDPSALDYQRRNHALEEQNRLLMSAQKELEKSLEAYRAVEEQRRISFEEKLGHLGLLLTYHQEQEQKLLAEKERLREEHILALKKTWQTHESLVEVAIKGICIERSLEYVEDFPDKDPDNVIRIAGEFVIFDAKSPANDNLANFPSYIKEQAKAIKKYLHVENVRREVFLVIPDSCLEAIKCFYYPFSDYQVFVVSTSSLMPVIMTLKRIEEYEFAESLSPKERAQVISYLGKSAHILKRRLEVDHYFAHETFGLLSQKDLLPAEFITDVASVEKASVFNPPMDKGKKTLLLKKLELEHRSLQPLVESLSD